MSNLLRALGRLVPFAPALPALGPLCAVIFSAGALAAPPPPLLVLPDGPIASQTRHPNIMLDLSVEFPTVGPAYRSKTYLPTLAYLGHFDATKCYDYKGKSTYSGGKYDNKNDDQKYFMVSGNADASHRCSGAFSGSFMNWAATSAIDIMRLTLSGGDRVVDRVGLTVLQRAVLPDFDYANSAHFPVITIPGSSAIQPADVTPFAVGTMYIISCRNRILFSTLKPIEPDGIGTIPSDDYTRCDAEANPDKNLGEFQVRVEVCSDTEGPARTSLCRKYGAHYKPEGQIQAYADRLHFGVMGYLRDNDQARYGGVLRAPLRYVGDNIYSGANMARSANPAPEWSSRTGIFNVNPLADPIGASGVISALNRFGRTGEYKHSDPVAELYYESIRYLQGLQPSPAAVSGLVPGSDTYDGLPILTRWIDPIEASCQRNAVILIADADTHMDFAIPGNTRTVRADAGTGPILDGPRAIESTSTPALDIMAWTRAIGLKETTPHGVDGTVRPKLANMENLPLTLPWPGGHESGYYMAGLAYWANLSELRKDKAQITAQTYVIDVDEYGNGVTTDANSRPEPKPRDGWLYLAAKYGGYRPEKNPPIPHDPLDPYWPVPGATSPKSTAGCYAYLWDPNGNCDPPNYYLASDGFRFAQSLKSIFAQQSLLGEAIAGVSASSEDIVVGTPAYVYQGTFALANASGDLRRSPVVYNGGTAVSVGAQDAASPVAILKEPDWPPTAPPPGMAAVVPRKIFTLDTKPAPTSSTVPFEWATLAPAQRASLNGTDGLGEARLHFLRGSTNGEYSIANPTGQFRQRPAAFSGGTNVLGDIVHSNPTYVGAPRLDVQGAGYNTFVAAHKNRSPAVYVGANDGMLHAFSATLDKEYFAYVPAMIFSGLNNLTSTEFQHRPYVDGAITVAEAKVGNAWKTVLASSMGAGAQGVFALDVSDPVNFSPTAGALWEFSDADDRDMGNLYGAPVVAKFNTAGAGQPPIYQYFVVVASGVNNYAADGASALNPGGVLFLLSLNKSAAVAWKLNVNYFKLPIPTAQISTASASGLSTPALVTDGNGAVRVAYAGDLQGNLWRFSFQSGTPIGTVQPHRIFTAKQPGGAMQSITAAPSVVYAPDGGYVVLFGTGRYLEANDVAVRTQDSYYGIFDDLTPTYAVADRSELALRTLGGPITAAQLSVSGTGFSYSSGTVKKGWYVDFLSSSSQGTERSVTPGQLTFGNVQFNTLIPPPPLTGCEVPSSGRAYAVNALTGLATATDGTTAALSSVGILSTPVIFNLRSNVAEANRLQASGKKIVKQKYASVGFGSSAATPPVSRQVDLHAGRLSWREVFNYKGLVNGN